jgi:hypothetical protein
MERFFPPSCVQPTLVGSDTCIIEPKALENVALIPKTQALRMLSRIGALLD